MNPLFTLITPVWNRETHVVQTIESLEGQYFNDWEHIIIDNNSTDRSFQVCKVRESARRRVLRCEQQGVAFARNCGIKEANGRWIVHLDSDNVLFRRDSLNRLAQEVQRASARCLAVFSKCALANGQLVSFSKNDPEELDLGGFVASLRGEWNPTVKAEWYKRNLHPECKGSYECLVWYRAAREGTIRLGQFVTQIYGTECDNKITERPVDGSRAEELSLYYGMLLKEFGREIRDGAPSVWWNYALRTAVYGKIARANLREHPDVDELPSLAKLMWHLPAPLLSKGVNAYKRHVTQL